MPGQSSYCLLMNYFLSILSALFLLPSIVSAQRVVAINIDQAITPVTASFIERSIKEAENKRASCLLIHLNTPGGQLTATREIVGTLLESSVPIVVYVSPGGARAGSAGVFITMAANIAAMAPGTNIGASHPVNLQGGIDSTLNEKITNDASALIRSVAEKRGHNAVWAEQAVRQSVSITETEALQQNVVNLIATSTGDLLQKIDGDSVTTASGPAILHTRHAQVETLDMGLGEKMLVVLSDPNIMYILLLLGIVGILFEFYNPGAIFPGIIGVICLILAFYAMSIIPINYAGLALIIFAVVLFLLELKITSHGLLALGGIVSMLVGSLMLIRTGPVVDYVKISRIVIFTSVLLCTVFFLFIIGMGLKAQRRTPVSGVEGFIGEIGVALDDLAPFGKVWVHGEIWNAESLSGVLKKGQKVSVARMEGLKIFVSPAADSEML